MSVTIMTLVFKAAILDPSEKLVMLSYADHANDEGQGVYPSQDRTSRRTGLSERAIRNINHRLEERGLLSQVGVTSFRTIIYAINVPLLAELEHAAPQTAPQTAPEAPAEGEPDSGTTGTTFRLRGNDVPIIH